ncbi:arylsulfatase [Luteolibacter luteus]|uniref:Arylsulfatase n=1 Tax=Luteolibacter luteus TaxID=2728835 RepID=A0A858RHM4_9BACT|nr:arylsulfatase [Luteolibacter luteus]QJE96332.1 arylsulfatase [Luteolibacter luteus]
MRLPLLALLAGMLPCHSQDIIFSDTFDRPDNRNIDAVLTGITNNTGTALPEDGVYSQPWLDPASRPPTYGAPDADPANGGGSQILSNVFRVKVGTGTANAFVNHNFTNAPILNAGGFSVSMDVTGYNQATAGQGGAFGIGMTAAEAASMGDAMGNGTAQPHLSNAFGTSTNAVADFWYAIRGNNTVTWGSGDTVLGTATVAAKTGKLTANFSVQDFNAGSVVGFQVLYGTTVVGSGTFTWTDTNANYIAMDGRDNTFVSIDNFSVSTFTPVPSVTFSADPKFVPANNTALPVNLSWTTTGMPAGATFQITADKSVSFPNGGNSGAAANGTGTITTTVDGSLGDTTFTYAVSNSSAQIIASGTATIKQVAANRPNVIVILADDMGWSDLGCYGSEIPTPNLDALAANGARFRQFYNSARCSPTRVSLLTGLYPQQGAVNPAAALPDLRNDNNVTFAELLGSYGYRTYMAGKWHLGNGALLAENRGFQHVWRMGNGQANNTDQWNQSAYTLVSRNNEIPFRDYAGTGGTFYQTDAIGDYAVDYINHNLNKADGAPFAMYLAFGAPHFPIQAPAALADTFTSTYAQGWDVIRQARYNRQLANGVIDSRYPFPGLGGTGPHQAEPIVPLPAWNTLPADRQADLTRRMSLYAAMIKKLDDNVGKVVTRLQQTGQLDNTLIFFMSDNGGNHEGGIFGNTTGAPLTGAALANMGQAGQGDMIHYGGGLAHVSNTPLKLFKHFTHEGGIRAPFIVHWPAGFSGKNFWVETPGHLVDVVATINAVTGTPQPSSFNGHPVLPLEGINLKPLLDQQAVAERPIFVEHEANRMIRKGKWKLVTENFRAFDGEFPAHQKLLYDMDADPGESNDLAAQNPAKVVELVDEWNAWSTRVGLPPERLITPPPSNLTPAPTTADLFLDTFNRAAAVDIDASNSGMSGSRVPPLGSGTTWFEGWEGSGTTDSIQITDNILQMATGAGMSESGVNHNFTGQDIVDAGGFSVSLRVLSLNSDATDTANRYAGFGVGLNAAQAAAGNDIGTANPPPIRGNGTVIGTADCFLELDLNGNVKMWADGAVVATVPVGKTKGTLTASFACSSFAAGAPVTVSAYFDGEQLDLDPSSAAATRNFAWDEANANYLALSARATGFAQMDNFAVRKLPLAASLGLEYLLNSGLDGGESSLLADPDGDGMDNFGEWAFGTHPDRSDAFVAATSLVLMQPSVGTFRFAHRRLSSFAAAGLNYRYMVSTNLSTWHEAAATEESTSALAGSPGYESATLTLSPGELAGQDRLFLKIEALP